MFPVLRPCTENVATQDLDDLQVNFDISLRLEELTIE